MPEVERSITILLAEDDADDQLLIVRALKQSGLVTDIRTVWDGEELMEYLRHEGRYTDPDEAPRPVLILLDLNMPRKSGREALREIKQDPALRAIPIVVLTTSQSEIDVTESYTAGANAFITKPVTFGDLADVVRKLEGFWFEVVHLPVHARQSP